MRIADRTIARATVVGFGRTGKAVTQFLLSHGVTPFVSEACTLPSAERRWLRQREVRYEEGGHTETGLTSSDLLVLSPGVATELPLLKEARRRGLLILSELDLACCTPLDGPIVGVTGTNGKSTTVKLVDSLLRRAGKRTAITGNIGRPLIDVVSQTSSSQVLVVEVSSFQLEQSRAFHPRVAVMLNLAPDHLDRHKTMAAYTAAKARLFSRQTKDDVALLPQSLAGVFPGIRARRVLFDRLPLPNVPFIDRCRPHNRDNLRAAIAACLSLFPDFDPSVIRWEHLQEALHLPYRLCYEGTLEGRGVFNDSKATNAAATIAALVSVPEPIVLILGGRHKHAGYAELARGILEREVRETVLYGEAAPFLEETLVNVGYRAVHQCLGLHEAVDRALTVSWPGDTILFSPACSSYDQYENYLERGEDFSFIIRSFPSFTPR